MKVKINGKPTQVSKDDDVSGINWVYLGVTVTGYSLIFYVLDLAGWVFLGVHPFPFTKFVGVILGWLGLL